MQLSMLFLAAMLAEAPVKWPAMPRYEPMSVPADNPMTAEKVELAGSSSTTSA